MKATVKITKMSVVFAAKSLITTDSLAPRPRSKARRDGTVLGLQRSGKTGELSQVEGTRDRLEPNKPNPFNGSDPARSAPSD